MELFKSPLADSGSRTLYHPLTGEPIRPIGYVRGKPVWPVLGAAPDDDDDDADASDDSDEDDADDDADSGGDDDDSESKSKDKSKDKKDADDDEDEDTVSRARYDKVKERLRAQDKHLSKVQAQLKELQDKDTSADQQVTTERDELKVKVSEHEATIAQLRMDNAFLSANTHPWHKPKVAMKVAQSEGYLEDVADDDGEVDERALKKALDKLAKEHSYLLKSKASSSSDGDDDDKRKKSGPSGASGPGRTQSKDKKQRRSELSRRMPALR